MYLNHVRMDAWRYDLGEATQSSFFEDVLHENFGFTGLQEADGILSIKLAYCADYVLHGAIEAS